jgi:hypothetical protein
MSTFLGRKKIDAKDKRRITKDWLSFFPGFHEYKPLWILRRNGPFLCGIHLERHSSNTDYAPLFHTCNLMVDFPVIPLSGSIYLLNHNMARDCVTVRQHQESFTGYAERLKNQVCLLQKDTLSCDEIVAHLKTAARHSYTFSCPSITSEAWAAHLLRDIVLALFWCGKQRTAEQELENAKKIMSEWDENVWVIRELGVKGWERELRKLMNMDALQSTVKQQLKKFNLGNFSDSLFTL